MNPDNVATPIAAALGDLVTLTLLSLVATWLVASGGPWAMGLFTFYTIIAIYSFRLPTLSLSWIWPR